MKWPKLLKKMYQACLEHDRDRERELFLKALNKSIKDREKGKTKTVTQVIVRD